MMVIRCGIQPEYFLNEMDQKETGELIKEYNKKYKEDKEEIRWLGYIIAQSLTGGYKKPSDLRKFPWDEEVTSVQKIDKEELKRRQEHLLSIINKVS